MTTEPNSVKLREELDALQTFLQSPGYRAALTVTEAEIQDGLDVLVNLELKSESDLYKLLESRGEVRALKKFAQRFDARIYEINKLLEKAKEPLDD